MIDLQRQHCLTNHQPKPYQFPPTSIRKEFLPDSTASLSLGKVCGSTVSRNPIKDNNEYVSGTSISNTSLEELPHPSQLFRRQKQKCTKTWSIKQVVKRRNDVELHLQELKYKQAKWDAEATTILTTDEIMIKKSSGMESNEISKTTTLHNSNDLSAKPPASEEGFVFKPILLTDNGLGNDFPLRPKSWKPIQKYTEE